MNANAIPLKFIEPSVTRPRKIAIPSLLILSLLTSLLLSPLPASAADKTDDKKESRQAARRLAQIRQQLEAEKTQLQTQFAAEKTALEDKANRKAQESDALQASLSAAQRSKAGLTAELAQLRKQITDLTALQQKTEASQRATQAVLDASQAKLAALEQQERDSTQQRKGMSARLVQNEDALGRCEDKNTKLHAVSRDLIKTCQQPAAFDKLLRSEPFTQVGQVQLENTLESYRDKVDEQRIQAR